MAKNISNEGNIAFRKGQFVLIPAPQQGHDNLAIFRRCEGGEIVVETRGEGSREARYPATDVRALGQAPRFDR